MTLFRYLVAATALTLTTIPAHANLFVDGDDKAPSQIATDPGIAALALNHLQRPFSVTANSKTITGTIDEYVLLDSSSLHLFSSCPGCLDFAFLVHVDTALNTGLEAFGFGRTNGLITDLDYVLEPGGIAPTFANRANFAGFDAVGFRNGTTHVQAGQNFDMLVIGTNATTTNNIGVLSINLDGTDFSNAAASGFLNEWIAPTLPTPEPSSVLLLSTAALAIGAAFRKKLG